MTGRFNPRFIAVVIAFCAALVGLLVFLSGCRSVPSTAQPTAHTAANVGAAIARADAKLAKAEPVIAEMTPATVLAEKPRLIVLVSESRGDLKEAAVGVKLTETQAKTDAKTIQKQAERIEELSGRDRRIIFWFGFGLTAIGVLGLLASLPVFGWVVAKFRRAFAFSAAAGIVFMALSHFYKTFMTIGLGFVIVILAMAAWFGWEWFRAHRKTLAASLGVETASKAKGRK